MIKKSKKKRIFKLCLVIGKIKCRKFSTIQNAVTRKTQKTERKYLRMY